jgi:hypothetical protein
MPTVTIEDFLRGVVEGYLFSDLEIMLAAQPSADGNGALSYPILTATCAGIELLGGLLTQAPFSNTKGFSYFSGFWSKMYSGPEALADDAVYRIARNGLAHVYCLKGLTAVTKGESQHHLTLRANAGLCIDATKLAEDFQATYRREVTPLLHQPSGRAGMQRHLDSMLATYDSDEKSKLQNVPLPQLVLPVGETLRPSGTSHAVAKPKA